MLNEVKHLVGCPEESGLRILHVPLAGDTTEEEKIAPFDRLRTSPC